MAGRPYKALSYAIPSHPRRYPCRIYPTLCRTALPTLPDTKPSAGVPPTPLPPLLDAHPHPYLPCRTPNPLPEAPTPAGRPPTPLPPLSDTQPSAGRPQLCWTPTHTPTSPAGHPTLCRTPIHTPTSPAERPHPYRTPTHTPTSPARHPTPNVRTYPPCRTNAHSPAGRPPVGACHMLVPCRAVSGVVCRVSCYDRYGDSIKDIVWQYIVISGYYEQFEHTERYELW
ncbi:extensin-like, partial [Penaeus japonicus]|uniref:extensin-like n=1 Tax=Penaeus japonicus TaxID=27405 RepID=UPI001C70F486